MENDQPQPQQEPHQEPQTPQSQQPQQSQSAHQTPSQHAQLNPQPQRPTHSRFPPPSHAPPSGTFLDLSFAPVPTLADLQALIQPAILDLDLTGNKLHELPELTQLVNLERFCIRQNYVTTLAGKFPEQCNKLDTVDLYDNRIESTEALKHFTSITYLDASFNELRVIEPHLASLTNLKELYLINNKITDIDAKGLVPLSALTLLELGSNRIRDIQNLDSLTNLRKLFLGRNKLTEIKGLSALHSLTCLSLQHNRITVIEGLDGLGQLQELYLSNNGITSIQGLSALTRLRILDLGHNFVATLQNLDHLESLEDFWCQTNKIEDISQLDALKANKKLSTVYFEHNPVQSHVPDYRMVVLARLPQLDQIDADAVTHRERAALNTQ